MIQVTYESAWSKNPPSGFIIFQLDLVQDSARHNHIACCLPQTLYRWAENRCESLSVRPTGNCEADPQQDHDLTMDGHCKFQAFPTRTVVPLPKNSLPKLVCLHCKSSYIIPSIGISKHQLMSIHPIMSGTPRFWPQECKHLGAQNLHLSSRTRQPSPVPGCDATVSLATAQEFPVVSPFLECIRKFKAQRITEFNRYFDMFNTF